MLDEDGTKNPFVESEIALPQWSVKDVEICEGACHVEENVKTVLSEPPCCREDGPEGLQSSKKALDENSLGPEPRHGLVTNDDRRDISLGPTISEIRKKSTPIKQTVQLGSVISQSCYVVNAARVRLGNESGCPTSEVHANIFLEA